MTNQPQQIEDDRALGGIPVSLVFAVIMIIAIIIFALQNTGPVMMKLYLWNIEVPLVLLLFITLGIGVVLAVLFSIPGWRKKRKIIKQSKKRVSELESQIADLSKRAPSEVAATTSVNYVESTKTEE